MFEVQDTDVQRQNLVSYLEVERIAWLPLYVKARRAGFVRREFNDAANAVMDRINPLLDELSSLVVGSEVEQ